MKTNMHENIIASNKLTKYGKLKIEWVKLNMPILQKIEKDFKKTQPFKNLRILVCIHLEAKTAYLSKIFALGGAQVAVIGSNSNSTKDDVVASLAADKMHVYARNGADQNEMKYFMNLALDLRPNIIVDDGGDLVEMIHSERSELLPDVLGACEETTTGVHRAKLRAQKNVLSFPTILINDAKCKYLFDNYHGTGQSVLEGIMRTTNLVISGKTIVVVGYGWCGKGCAERAKGLGANVIVCEVDNIKAAEAMMHGIRVMKLINAVSEGDFILTVTGGKNVIKRKHFEKMKDGVILANAGHFNIEYDIGALKKLSIEQKERRNNIVGYKLKNGNWINLLGNGDLVNISCSDGHPAEIMDMSFALQALSARYLVMNHKNLIKGIHSVPEEIDQEVAKLKLESAGVYIDKLIPSQKKYLDSW
tara:strand:+ start:112 stop:1368 length:1257 start_codon:yes stop_codon:yes gene_type:complete